MFSLKFGEWMPGMTFANRMKSTRVWSLLSLASLVILLASVFPAKTYAQGNDILFRSALFDDVFGTDDFVNDPFTAPGSSGWITHLGGDGPGTRPFTELGGLVPIYTPNGAWLFQGSGRITNDGKGGTSLVTTRRFIVGDFIIGGYGSYDITQSRNNNTFHQLGIGGEVLTNGLWSLRGSAVFPVGPQTQNVSSGMGALGTVYYQGNNLLVDGINTLQNDDVALRNISLEVARGLGDWSGEAFVGYYNLQGPGCGSTDGFQVGVRGYITPSLKGNVAVSDDPLFGTNVFGGFTFFFGGTGGRAPETLYDMLTLPVERTNQQVAIKNVQSGTFVPGTVVLTDGGVPITITHVNNNAMGLNLGTFEDPFQTLPATQPTDIVLLHHDSVFSNQSYTLDPGQRLLGEGDGNENSVFTDQFGNINLPSTDGGTGVRPTITAPFAQYAVYGASNTEVANIVIDNLGNTFRGGMMYDGMNANFNHVVIDGGLSGMEINNGTGLYAFNDVHFIDQSEGTISISGGSADYTFDATSTIDEGATPFYVGGHTGSITYDGTINADSQGLQFFDADGTYTFNGQFTNVGNNAGIDIGGGSSGTFTFVNTDITRTAGGSVINIADHDTGTVNFGPNSSIAATDGVGLRFNNADGTYNFESPIALNGGDAGIDIIGGSDGTFTFSGPTNITNSTGIAVNIDGGMAGQNANVRFTDLLIHQSVGDGVRAVNTDSVFIGFGGMGTNSIENFTGSGIFLDGINNFTLDNTTITNNGGGMFTINAANSNLSGSGNTAMPFSSNDGGGNTGTIQFNGGANTAP
ncbi:MAG: right-handed parallel beta-helix repeat-containing protein [Planctomycetaceae bacterium]|nr:right-handed parallel beta-helix repeat-containing protein [Planctomycetaceae bacterium]